jgi:hypothetical protein
MRCSPASFTFLPLLLSAVVVGTSISGRFDAADAVAAPHPPHSATPASDRAHLARRQGQIVIKACPETLGDPMQKCSACGTDSKKPGTCNKLLLSGDQRNCGETGCGVYCKCIPDGDSTRPAQPGDDQIPLQTCPETLSGGTKKNCSECGGEDPANPGKCTKVLLSGSQSGCPAEGCGYICECDNGAGTPESSSARPSTSVTPSPTTTTGDSRTTAAPEPTSTALVTSVIDGSTVTGTFSATSLSEWKDLRYHTVVTTTTTAADTHETEAVVLALFAGGVAWWLYGNPPSKISTEPCKLC